MMTLGNLTADVLHAIFMLMISCYMYGIKIRATVSCLVLLFEKVTGLSLIIRSN